jgi:alpha-glucosidase
VGPLILLAAASVALTSPNGRIALTLSIDAAGHAVYSVALDAQPVLEDSPLGIVVDGRNLGDHAALRSSRPYAIDEQYPWLGVHAIAHARCRGSRVSYGQWELDARACDDGVAFRYSVPGRDAVVRTPDEGTAFRVPAGSTVWSHDFEGHYEGIHTRAAIEDVPAGQWAAPPLTIKLPRTTGYASITESALAGYAGMGLRADGRRGYLARLGHDQPVSYPYRLRYRPEDIERLSRPAPITGTITTPWRVVIIGRTLNDLVNADIVHNVAPKPDPRLFQGGWIRPGRAVWRYLDGGENTLEGVTRFNALAEQLGFEYHVVEGLWRRWSDGEMRGFMADAAAHHVGIWLWQDSRALTTPAEQRAFFDLCVRYGAVGAKIDFFDHEAKEMIDRYQSILREAAEHHILLDFHGANKPAGEARTWPNELTREAISGLERRSTPAWAPHTTTLPFTRFLAGGADFTPVVFGERRKDTTAVHQLATAAVFTSPLLVYGAHPQSLLDNPAVDIVKTLPSVWDETIVLPGSEIGQLAAYARRRGDDWYIAVLNGSEGRTLIIDTAFLGPRSYQATIARDTPGQPATVTMDAVSITQGQPLRAVLSAGGGLLARLRPQ